ncbi:MAG TPA: ATP-binding protein [Thermoanaerobaculia bacterium]|nr:ATP-binding protein [Thermoanaerobaculia bacterium]
MSEDVDDGSARPEVTSGLGRQLPLILTVVLGASASLVVFSNLRAQEWQRIAMDVERGVHELVILTRSPLVVAFSSQVERRLGAMAEELSSLDEVTQEAVDEHRWVIRWAQAPAFFVNVEYLPRVLDSERVELERSAGRGGSRFRVLHETADGSVVAADARPVYFPVLFETSDVASQERPGVDHYTDPLARLAMDRARDSGAVASHGHIPLQQSPRYDMVFHYYLPLYAGGVTPESVEERRERLRGFVSAVSYSTLDELGFLVPATLQGIDTAIYPDDGKLEAHELSLELAEALARGTLTQTFYEGAGEPIRLVARATPPYVAARRSADSWSALALGLLTTGLVSSLLLRAGQRSAAVARLVQERTRELNEQTEALSAANRRLIVENEERQRAEEALRESETRYRLVAQNLSDVIYTHDLEFTCTYISPSVTQQRGFEVDEILGKNILANLTPESADDARKQLEYVLRAIEKRPELARGHRTSQFEAICKDGSTITLENRTSLLFDDDRSIIGVLGVSRDISDRKQVEQEKEELESRYRHAQKMEALGTLAGGVAHDFNNLLTGILGYTDLLKLEVGEETQAAHSVGVIERAATRAQELTAQLLGFARKGKFQSVSVDLNEAIGDVIAFLERTLHKNIQVSQRLSGETPWVTGDPSQIHQLLLNLAVNARDAMPAGGQLTFSTELVDVDEDAVRAHVGLTPGRYNRITVSDTGVGIPSDRLERIFEPFFTDKVNGSGTGMGLAMVYGVTKSHRGSVSVHSEEGQGSVFEIYLPYSPDLLVRAPKKRPEMVRGAGTILVVDDEEIIRELARELLGQLGYTVITANDGVQALEVFRAHRADIEVVIIDVMMPRMGGRECLERLREIDPNVKAIFATAYASEELQERELEGEGAGFLQKPYRMQQLSESVAEAIGRVPSALNAP